MISKNKPYALGMMGMLADAFRIHQIANFGESPKRFELHPEVVRMLLDELHELRRVVPTNAYADNLKFMGVPVIADPLVTQQKLIDCRNQVIYL